MAKRAIAYLPLPSSPSERGAAGSNGDAGKQIAAFVRDQGWVLIEPFVELARGELSQLERALDRCAELGAILVVPSLASAGRDREFLDRVLSHRVPLAALDRPRIGRATLEVLRDVAQERSARISARSKEALRRAQARGVTIGSPRPEIGARRAGVVLRDRANLRARMLAPVVEEIRLSNPDISLRGIAQVLTDQGVPTPRGGQWGPSTVKSILDRWTPRAGRPGS